MTYDELETKFAGFTKGEEQQTLIDAKHQLWLWAGVSKSRLPVFMVSEIPDGCSMHLQSTAGIDVTWFDNPQGGHALVFRCEDIRMSEVFKRLCYDFVEASRNCRDIAEGLNIIGDRFDDWRRLLQGKSSGKLTRQKQMGLFAELIFLESCLKTMQPSQAVNAWRGPNKGAQDFLFGQSWAEIKAISKSATSVEISSLAQLALENPGTLEVYALDKAENVEEPKDAVSLAKLVQRVRRQVGETGTPRQSLDEKLLLAGYHDKDESAYATPIVILDHRTYSVSGEFPRLTPITVPAEIVDAHYQIALHSLNAFLVENEEKLS